MNCNKITIHEFLVIIMTSLDELFSLYCMKQLKMPPDLQELPQYDALTSGLTRKQRTKLIELFDEFSLSFSVYSAECFAQGMRVAFSLSQQLYPLE